MDKANQTYNGVPIAAILTPTQEQPDLVQRIASRLSPAPLYISDPSPDWPAHFETFKSRIISAFAEPPQSSSPHNPPSQPEIKMRIISITHIGSTSIPSLPAKPIIDIDLVLSPSVSLAHENLYIPLLENAGFRFLLREPHWHQHRFLVASPPAPMECNLHVWGATPVEDRAEVERHVVFRDWLRSEGGEADRLRYAEVKKECVREVVERGEGMEKYTQRKQEVVRGILGRAMEWVGLVDDGAE